MGTIDPAVLQATIEKLQAQIDEARKEIAAVPPQPHDYLDAIADAMEHGNAHAALPHVHALLSHLLGPRPDGEAAGDASGV